ncbi:hypothetical protein FQA39_LY15431 [Lamprigera yunnana]|nr:hypothetical protein FQA39_LY15431 [Lamprigera yunnana]
MNELPILVLLMKYKEKKINLIPLPGRTFSWHTSKRYAYQVMESANCTSENASSICDEERVRRLFQACDTNDDGFIDNQGLLTVCRELSLVKYIDELMLELGADAQGRISYEQFLQRRLSH